MPLSLLPNGQICTIQRCSPFRYSALLIGSPHVVAERLGHPPRRFLGRKLNIGAPASEKVAPCNHLAVLDGISGDHLTSSIMCILRFLATFTILCLSGSCSRERPGLARAHSPEPQPYPCRTFDRTPHSRTLRSNRLRTNGSSCYVRAPLFLWAFTDLRSAVGGLGNQLKLFCQLTRVAMVALVRDAFGDPTI